MEIAEIMKAPVTCGGLSGVPVRQMCAISATVQAQMAS